MEKRFSSGRTQRSSLFLATSIPTNEEREPSMEMSLSCKCELVAGVDRRRFWRLSGLFPRSRRRSRFVAVLRDLDTIDLPSAAVGQAAALRDFGESLRLAACPTADLI